jgi:hypothetical protein
VRAHESISGVAMPLPAPLALAMSPTSRRVQIDEGSTALIRDSASVVLSGETSGATMWTASKRRAWTTLTNAAGTGSGRLRWNRNPTGLAAGVWVDTITVSAGALSARVIDTMIVAVPKQKGSPKGKGTGKPN